MPTPCLTDYHGEMLSLSQVEKRFRIHWSTLKSWRAHGGVSAKRIDRHVAAREKQRLLREQARANGIPDAVRRKRLVELRWDEHEAVTTPVQQPRRAA